ncbi:MAG: hypothetical protein GX808_08125 [Syntrophomonadaceae bacterium]|jgi:hypothetical protein|nr:hypothetical protein [Syntrophomonadaceae bacterium]
MSHPGKILYPEAFKSKLILVHWEFENDLRSILEKSGHTGDFLGKYKQRLKLLDDMQKQCVLKNDWFENLRYANDIYCMKFNKSQKNIRILFAFVGNNCALLLSAFEEKDNKKMSQDSYRKHIPLAQKRLKEVIADD